MHKASVLDLLYQCCTPPASRSLGNSTQTPDDSCTEVNNMYTSAFAHARYDPYAPLSATLALQLCTLLALTACHCGSTVALYVSFNSIDIFSANACSWPTCVWSISYTALRGRYHSAPTNHLLLTCTATPFRLILLDLSQTEVS